MALPPIHLAFLKRVADDSPHLFDDTVFALVHLLRRAGVEVHIGYNRIVPDALNLVVGAGMPGTPTLAELRQFARPDNTIIFNTEQLGSSSNLITPEYIRLLQDYVVWDYCQDNINALQRRSPDGVRCHEFPIVPPMEYGVALRELPTDRQFNFDLAFYGAVDIPRRITILQQLHQSGLRVKIISGAFGQALAGQLLDCKAVLNLHAYDTGLFEISRCLRPIAMSIPIISETSLFPASVDWASSGIAFVPTAELHACCQTMVTDIRRQQEAQRRMRYFMHSIRWPELVLKVLADTVQQLGASA